jgi:hypothetical protein
VHKQCQVPFLLKYIWLYKEAPKKADDSLGKGIDTNTLPREATVILEIPTISNNETSVLAGVETLKFNKSRQSWLYNSFIKLPNWQDNWWQKCDGN